MPSREPTSLMELAIEPRPDAGWEKMRAALMKLAEIDIAFSFASDPESGQIIIRGVSEEHLDEKITALKRACDFEFNIGQPQVAYRETITRAADIDYTYKKQIGAAGEFARVIFRILPLEGGVGYVFENQITNGALPEDLAAGFENGMNSIRETGLLVGFPIIDFKIELYGGAFHEIDSSARAFEIAARKALREYKHDLGLVLLEPIMTVTITSPLEYASAITEEMAGRGGQRKGQTEESGGKLIFAAPLRQMFGFVNSLKTLTDGRTSYEMEFSHYGRVPTIDDDPSNPNSAAMREYTLRFAG